MKVRPGEGKALGLPEWRPENQRLPINSYVLLVVSCLSVRLVLRP